MFITMLIYTNKDKEINQTKDKIEKVNRIRKVKIVIYINQITNYHK